MDPKNLPRVLPKTKNTQNQNQQTQQSSQNVFRWDKVPYSRPIYLRVSKKLLQKLKMIDPTIRDDITNFILEPVSGLVWIEGMEKPLTHIETFRILKTYFKYENHVKPFH